MTFSDKIPGVMAKTRIFPRRAAAVRRPSETPPVAPKPTDTPPAVEPKSEPTPDRAARVIDRIGVPIDESGAFDLDSMRPATRERFDAALKKTRFPQAQANAQDFRPVASMAVDAVVSLQVMAATVLRCTPEEARHFAWSVQQRAVLADQLGVVLSRHPGWMENAPEALLAATYCGFLVASVQAIRREREGGPAASLDREPSTMPSAVQ